jgi:hypothetical protein
VGRSAVAEFPVEIDDHRTVRLRDFSPLAQVIDRKSLPEFSVAIRQLRADLESRYPKASLYMPFQLRSDGDVWMMQNYFTKLPAAAASMLFSDSGSVEPSVPRPDELPAAAPTRRWRAEVVPFKPKADTDYITRLEQVVATRTRAHETLGSTITSPRSIATCPTSNGR